MGESPDRGLVRLILVRHHRRRIRGISRSWILDRSCARNTAFHFWKPCYAIYHPMVVKAQQGASRRSTKEFAERTRRYRKDCRYSRAASGNALGRSPVRHLDYVVCRCVLRLLFRTFKLRLRWLDVPFSDRSAFCGDRWRARYSGSARDAEAVKEGQAG